MLRLPVLTPSLSLVLALCAAMLALPAAAQDAKNSKDHPLVGRYEGAVIKKYMEKAYEEFSMVVKPVGPKDKDRVNELSIPLAGKLTRILYEGPENRSGLEVVRNFQKKLEADGFTTLFYCRQKDCGGTSSFWSAAAGTGSGMVSNWATNIYAILKKSTPQGDVHVSVFANELGGAGNKPLTPQVLITVAETQAMEDDKIVVRDASAMEQAISAEGRIALYGIYFDFDKADVKAESDPQLDEIAKLLKGQPNLNVLVVGHTDGKGALDYNLGLSQRRATAVVDLLISRYGVAPARVVPVGVGMAAPIASNASDEGRAKNRRVEIVGRL